VEVESIPGRFAGQVERSATKAAVDKAPAHQQASEARSDFPAVTPLSETARQIQ